MSRTMSSYAFAAFIWMLAFSNPPTIAAGPKRTHDVTVDDYFTQAEIFEAAISPDGKYVAYAEGRWQASTDDRKTDLWLANVQTGKATRLTSDRAADRALHWSPDSHWIYFAGNRQREAEKHPPFDGKTQVWRISINGGYPDAVTRVEGGIDQFDLAHDGQSLYYVTEKEAVGPEWKNLKQRFRDIHYGHGVNHLSQVWKLNLENWRAESIVDDNRVIRDFAVSPDGRRLAMISTPDDTVVSFEGQSRVDIFDAETKTITPLPDKLFRADAPSPYGWLERLAWSPDSQALAFCIIFDAYPAEVIVAGWTGSQPAMSRLRRPDGLSLHGYGSPLAWRNATDLCFVGDDKARARLYCASDLQSGKPKMQTITSGDVVVAGFSYSPASDRTGVVMSGPTQMADLFLVEGSKKPRRLTHINPQADTWKMPRISTVSWKGANGDTVEGILELPPAYQSGQRLPLVVEIHGGPTTANYFTLQFAWFNGGWLLPTNGYAILRPNYRGSTGYGDKFLTDLVGHENERDVEDILKGVDALIERGIADPDHLGVMGWSNGGYLTNCLITTTGRFKAASSGAGILDTVMEWGANDEPAYVIAFKQGFPWTKADAYRRASPTYRLDKIRTPTLIHVGGADERCPAVHSRMLYRALKEYVKVPTELLIYPGEPHSLAKYKNRKAKMEWDLAWFDRYLRGHKDKEKPQ